MDTAAHDTCMGLTVILILLLVAGPLSLRFGVEGAVLLPLVVPQRHPLDRGRFDLLGALQHEHMAEAFPTEAAKRTAKLRVLNQLGRQGWELVAAQQSCTASGSWTFKRKAARLDWA